MTRGRLWKLHGRNDVIGRRNPEIPQWMLLRKGGASRLHEALHSQGDAAQRDEAAQTQGGHTTPNPSRAALAAVASERSPKNLLRGSSPALLRTAREPRRPPRPRPRCPPRLPPPRRATGAVEERLRQPGPERVKPISANAAASRAASQLRTTPALLRPRYGLAVRSQPRMHACKHGSMRPLPRMRRQASTAPDDNTPRHERL
eukprot:358971-Chlamydomonas_euryale.AAC.2